jgi:hypothetical protein
MPKVGLLARRVIAAALLTAAASGGTVVAVQTPASAATTNTVCGGVKHGTGWQTHAAGGWTGNGCGAGIDYHSANAGSGVNSYYYFPRLAGGVYTVGFYAYIPIYKDYANAWTHFTAYCDSTFWADWNINENSLSGWVHLYANNFVVAIGSNGCQPKLVAYSNTAGGTNMGLDATQMTVG